MLYDQYIKGCGMYCPVYVEKYNWSIFDDIQCGGM